MDEAMKKLMQELSEKVKSLSEAVATKFSSAAPAQAEAEKDKLVERILELEKGIKTIQQQKVIRKMAWAVKGAQLSEGVKGVTFGQFLKAVEKRDDSFFADMGIEKSANGQNETTSADGGYLVPVEYANEIVKLELANSIARRICRIFPMGSLTRTIPRQLTNPTVTWVNEAGVIPKTKVTFEQFSQTAKKIACIIPVTAELLADNNVNLDTFLFQVVAEAIGREEDRVAFVGNNDPFYGVLYATGVNSVSMAGATGGWGDLVDLMYTATAPYRADSRFVIGTDALRLIMKMQDDQGRPIWSMPVTGFPGTVFGRPYDESDLLGSSIIYGNFGKYLWISDRGGYEVKGSDSASDANAGAGSAFTQDEIWYRFKRRENIMVVQPSAFSKITLA